MTDITMHPVESSNIEAIGHDNGTLHVRYKNGTTYTYADVPESTFNDARAAKSVGGFLHANVKGKFAHTKLDDGSEAGGAAISSQP